MLRLKPAKLRECRLWSTGCTDLVANDVVKLEQAARHLNAIRPQYDKVDVYGPAQAPLSRVGASSDQVSGAHRAAGCVAKNYERGI